MVAVKMHATKNTAILLAAVLATGCFGRAVPPPPPEEEPDEKAKAADPGPRPKRPAHPLDRRVTFQFQGATLPEVISRIAGATGVGIAVSPSIPVEEWRGHRVTLRVADVTLWAVLDWLVRPLRAGYAVEADGSVWLTRGDELLAGEEMAVRSIRVPTHYRTRRIARGAFDYRREQKEILRVLDACLGYLYRQRRGCRLAFHGEVDVLVAALPKRGQARLDQLLDAMRFGTEPPPPIKPSRDELRAKLDAPVACEGLAGTADKVLVALAERARVNLGWDGARLGSPTIALPGQAMPLRKALEHVASQTRIGRFHMEPGRGIWAYLDGDRRLFARSGAVPWDRAVVRAYDVRRLLGRRSPQAIVGALRKQVDPTQWESGLPAAAVFVPTRRLIVVHDETGQRRVRAVLDEMVVGRIRGIEEPKKKAQP